MPLFLTFVLLGSNPVPVEDGNSFVNDVSSYNFIVENWDKDVFTFTCCLLWWFFWSPSTINIGLTHTLFRNFYTRNTSSMLCIRVRAYCLTQAMWSCVMKRIKTEAGLKYRCWSGASACQWVVVLPCKLTLPNYNRDALQEENFFLHVQENTVCWKIDSFHMPGELQLLRWQKYPTENWFMFQFVKCRNIIISVMYWIKPAKKVICLSFLCLTPPPNLQKSIISGCFCFQCDLSCDGLQMHFTVHWEMLFENWLKALIIVAAA